MSYSLPPLATIPLDEAIQMRADLKRAMSTGALSVRYADGTSITYRSMAEMKAALNELEGSILGDQNAGDVTATPIRAFRITPFSGWR